MKQLINPLPVGRMPVFKDDLLILQDENYIATKAICQGIGSPIIVSGCVSTDNGGGNCTITSGVLFIDSEFIKFTGYTGSFPVYLKQGTPIVTTKTYFDSSTQNVYSERTIQAVTILPGSGEFFTFNFNNTADRLLAKINASPLSQINGLVEQSALLKHLQLIGAFALTTGVQTITSFTPFATKTSVSMRYTIFLEYTPPNDDPTSGQSILLILKRGGSTIKQFEKTVRRAGYREQVAIIWNEAYTANQLVTLEGYVSNNNATIHFGQVVMEAFDGI